MRSVDVPRISGAEASGLMEGGLEAISMGEMDEWTPVIKKTRNRWNYFETRIKKLVTDFVTLRTIVKTTTAFFVQIDIIENKLKRKIYCHTDKQHPGSIKQSNLQRGTATWQHKSGG